MGKSGNFFIKPGSLATQKKTKYERGRDRRIKEIRAKMKDIGIMTTLDSLRGSSLPKCTKEKGGGTGNEVDDLDYRPPSEEDNSDNESFDSFEHEVLEMPPSGLTRSHAEPQHESTTVLESVTHSTRHPMVETQPSPPSFEELQTETAASSSAEIQGLIDKNGGKLLVPIPQEHRAPVGIYASILASKIGVEVRENVQDLSVKSWKVVDEGIKAPLFQRLKDQFDLAGDPIDVHKAVATKSTNMTKHRCGSKSLPVRVNEYALKHGDELPNLPEFYKSTHYNGDKYEWISPECQTNYEKMKQIEAEHNEAGASPLTQEELSIAVLKKRLECVKGLGLRPSSSTRTTCESATTKEYVTRLEMKLEAREETIEKLLEANKQQQLLNASMLEFLISKGYTGHLGSAGLSSND